MATALRSQGQTTNRFLSTFCAWPGLSPLQQRSYATKRKKVEKTIDAERLRLLTNNQNELWTRIENATRTKIVPRGAPITPDTSKQTFRIHGDTHAIQHTRTLLNLLGKPGFDLDATLESASEVPKANQEQQNSDETPGIKRTFTVSKDALRLVQEAEPQILDHLQAKHKSLVQIDDDPDGNVSRFRVRASSPDEYEARVVKSWFTQLTNPHFDFRRVAMSDAQFFDDPDVPDLSRFSFRISPDTLLMLQANNQELLLRLQDSYQVKITFPNQSSTTRPRARIAGSRPNVVKAVEFVKTTLQDPPSPKNTADAYKLTMRHVPSSVVVLTTTAPSTPQPEAQNSTDFSNIRGMTVSSMTSVTLDPEPIVSFSVRRPSRTLDCITQGQPFFVNFLKSIQRSSEIAHILSRPHDDPSDPFRIITNSNLARISNQLPYLRGDCVPAHFKCEPLLDKMVEVGDHTVVFARVVDVLHSWNTVEPVFLAYAKGEYHRVNKPINGNAAQKPHKQEATAAPRSEDDSWLDSSNQNRAADVESLDAQSLGAQSEQEEAMPQETQDTNGATAAGSAERARVDDFNKKYWRMAAGEEDDVLEERAADQRALGEDQKPNDVSSKPEDAADSDLKAGYRPDVSGSEKQR